MDKKMNFKYFYGTEADQFSFYRIPKALFTNDCFKDLSCDAKILYGLMLDRMSLSIKNQWFDEENRAYIYFSIEDIMELLNCGRNKAVKSLQELDDEKGIGLIEKRRQGFGKVTIIYVKSFVQEECEEQKKEKSKMVKFINQTSVEEEETEEVYISNFKKSQKQTSRSPENKLQEVYISNSIKGFFDNVNHSKLIRQIWSLGIHDKTLIFIIKRILTAPIKMPDNTTVLPDKGTPQGGIISPLLANIVLNELDWWIASQWEENPIAISRGRERIIGKTKVFDKSHGYRIMKNTEMKEMHIIRYADDFRIFCRTKEDAVRTKEAVTEWIEERLKLEVSPEKTRIVNTRKRWSEFLGFKIRVRLKHHKYVVQSAICDKKVEIERAKLVEQAKNIAKPREKKSCLSEIQLYNSMVLGIQNYYQLATCISIDCREFHRRVMTVLTNRLNTETGSMLKREGGTITQAEKERFGQSKMIRYVSGIDQMIYPIAFIKNKIPMAKRSIVCSYTKEGRALIHTELNLNQYVLKGLREKISVGHSTEYHDSKISLFSAQKGKCAISGEEFADAEHVAVWLKVPGSLGGFERYKNMVLIHKKYLILLQELPQAAIKDLIKTLNITKKMLVKINSLREQANLSAII